MFILYSHALRFDVSSSLETEQSNCNMQYLLFGSTVHSTICAEIDSIQSVDIMSRVGCVSDVRI